MRYIDSEGTTPAPSLLKPVEPAKKPGELASRPKFRRFSFFVIPGGRRDEQD
jgi:hypothetical protein